MSRLYDEYINTKKYSNSFSNTLRSQPSQKPNNKSTSRTLGNTGNLIRINEMIDNYHEKTHLKEILLKESKKISELEDLIYMLQNNIHYKKNVNIDLDKGIVDIEKEAKIDLDKFYQNYQEMIDFINSKKELHIKKIVWEEIQENNGNMPIITQRSKKLAKDIPKL